MGDGVRRQGLTCRQAQVYDVIALYCALTGEVCTVSYVARRLNLDPSTVRQHLEALARKGWLPSPTPSKCECHPHTPEFRGVSPP